MVFEACGERKHLVLYHSTGLKEKQATPLLSSACTSRPSGYRRMWSTAYGECWCVLVLIRPATHSITAVVSTNQSTLDMEKKLNDVEQRLRQLENAFDGTSLQILRYCSRVLRQHRNRLGEHATELKKVPVVENERNYAQMLQRHFYTLKSPSSGECLFLAFAKAQMVYSYRVKFPQVTLASAPPLCSSHLLDPGQA